MIGLTTRIAAHLMATSGRSDPPPEERHVGHKPVSKAQAAGTSTTVAATAEGSGTVSPASRIPSR